MAIEQEKRDEKRWINVFREVLAGEISLASLHDPHASLSVDLTMALLGIPHETLMKQRQRCGKHSTHDNCQWFRYSDEPKDKWRVPDYPEGVKRDEPPAKLRTLRVLYSAKRLFELKKKDVLPKPTHTMALVTLIEARDGGAARLGEFVTSAEVLLKSMPVKSETRKQLAALLKEHQRRMASPKVSQEERVANVAVLGESLEALEERERELEAALASVRRKIEEIGQAKAAAFLGEAIDPSLTIDGMPLASLAGIEIMRLDQEGRLAAAEPLDLVRRRWALTEASTRHRLTMAGLAAGAMNEDALRSAVEHAEDESKHCIGLARVGEAILESVGSEAVSEAVEIVKDGIPRLRKEAAQWGSVKVCFEREVLSRLAGTP